MPFVVRSLLRCASCWRFQPTVTLPCRTRWTRSRTREILAAANILLAGHAAQPGAIFQSIELREPPKDVVLAFHPRRPDPARGAGLLPPEQEELQDHRRPDHGTFTPPVLIPKSDGQLGLTITEVSDFSFAFQNPAFLQRSPARPHHARPALHVLVQPLTAGSFGLPEETDASSRRRCTTPKAQASTFSRARSRACRPSSTSTTRSCSTSRHRRGPGAGADA